MTEENPPKITAEDLMRELKGLRADQEADKKALADLDASPTTTLDPSTSSEPTAREKNFEGLDSDPEPEPGHKTEYIPPEELSEITIEGHTFKVGDKFKVNKKGASMLSCKVGKIFPIERIEKYNDEVRIFFGSGGNKFCFEDEIEPVVEEPARTAQTPGNEPLPISEPLPTTPPVTSPKEKKEPKKEKGSEPKTTAEEVRNFFTEFNLIPPLEFGELSDAQKLKVVRDLKRRIVDIVKSDAQTQYSQTLKDRVVADTSVAGGILAGIAKKIKNLPKAIGIGMKNAAMKERDLKNLENKAFEQLLTTTEGKEFIQRDLNLLIEKTSRQKIYELDGKLFVLYINKNNFSPASEEEKNVADDFNTAADLFTQMPYEWGQEKSGGHKKKYEKAKAEYEKARSEIIKIRIKEVEKGKISREQALVDLAEMDNAIQMEQLLNTHPEFEQALTGFEKRARGRELGKTGKNILKSKLTWEGGGIGAIGTTARWAAKGAAVFSGMTGITFLVAPIIGGATGYWRGHVHGKKTLEERKKGARHGQKDENKEKAKMVDVEKLVAGLNKIINTIEITEENSFRIGGSKYLKTEGKQINKRKELLAKLAVVIDYTRDQVEKGQINFGNPKIALTNQFNLINSLNRAVVLQETNTETTNKEFVKWINDLIATQDKKVTHDISEAQKAFVRKQARIGAGIGAGFATISYVARWFFEHIYVEGGHEAGTAMTETGISPEETARLEKLTNLKKIFPKITDYQEIYENGQKVLIEKFNTGKIAKIFPDGSVEWYDETGKLFEKDILEKDEADILGIKILERAQTTTPQVEPTSPPETPAPEPSTPPAETPPTVEPIKPLVAETPKPTASTVETPAPKPTPEPTETPTAKPAEPVIPQTPKEEILQTPETPKLETPKEFYNSVTGIIEKKEFPDGTIEEYNPDGTLYRKILPDGTEEYKEYYEGEKEFPTEKMPETQEIPKSTSTTVEEARRAVLEKMETPKVATPKIPDVSGEVKGEGTPYWPTTGGRTGEFFPGISERENIVLQAHSEFVQNNPFHLNGEKLIQAYEVHQKNIEHVFQFHDDGLEAWKEMKELRADKILEAEDHDPNDQLANYLQKLRETTGLKPRGRNIFSRAENVEEYIARALQKATKEGLLNKLKLE